MGGALLLRGQHALLHTHTREGGLIKGGAGLGHALAIHVNLALRPVGSHLLVCAAPDSWVLLCRIVQGRQQQQDRCQHSSRSAVACCCWWCMDRVGPLQALLNTLQNHIPALHTNPSAPGRSSSQTWAGC